MKTLILNSGLGHRMGDITKTHPKCMTELSDNETILSRQLSMLNHVGIKDIIMTTGFSEDILKNYIESLNLPLNYEFVKNEIYYDTNYIYSIYCAKDKLDDDILLLHGDLVFDESVLADILKQECSCMKVSSTLPLPEKDFKAVIENGRVSKVGVNFFDSAVEAQALYKLNRKDWKIWLDEIVTFCENGNTKVYAENALNEISDKCAIYPFDVKDRLCTEIDTPEDLKRVREWLSYE